MKKYTLFGKNIVFDDAAEHAYEVQADYEFASCGYAICSVSGTRSKAPSIMC